MLRFVKNDDDDDVDSDYTPIQTINRRIWIYKTDEQRHQQYQHQQNDTSGQSVHLICRFVVFFSFSWNDFFVHFCVIVQRCDPGSSVVLELVTQSKNFGENKKKRTNIRLICKLWFIGTVNKVRRRRKERKNTEKQLLITRCSALNVNPSHDDDNILCKAWTYYYYFSSIDRALAAFACVSLRYVAFVSEWISNCVWQRVWRKCVAFFFGWCDLVSLFVWPHLFYTPIEHTHTEPNLKERKK